MKLILNEGYFRNFKKNGQWHGININSKAQLLDLIWRFFIEEGKTICFCTRSHPEINFCLNLLAPTGAIVFILVYYTPAATTFSDLARMAFYDFLLKKNVYFISKIQKHTNTIKHKFQCKHWVYLTGGCWHGSCPVQCFSTSKTMLSIQFCTWNYIQGESSHT